ncbi:MAG: hypothetical protein GX488_10940 [Clostridiales bacterium]|nr:hypothetical protein [Clostridiales bacterium]
MTLCLLSAILILLPACSSMKSAPSSLADNAWFSEGRAYKQSGVSMPGGYISVFSHGADFYANVAIIGINEPNRYELCKNGTETIYSPKNGCIDCASSNDEGIWIVETEKVETNLDEKIQMVSYSGEVVKSFALNDIARFDSSVYTIRCTSEKVYLKSPDKIVAVDNSGNYLSEYKVQGDSALVIGNDDCAYVANYTENGIEICALDGDENSPSFTLKQSDYNVYSGSEEFFLLMANDTGLYGLNRDGSQEAVIIWSDCGISLSRIMGIVALPDGKFLLLDAVSTSLLSPAEPSDMHKRITLTLATAGSADMVRGQVQLFNQSNSDYYIEIKDYSEGGACDTATAVTRMNTDLISGKYPDLIQLTDVSPYFYIKKGYLADMCVLLETDPDMSLEDIAIADQLMVDGGIYFIDREFYMDTRVGYYSDFGDVYGWTFEKYLDVEKNAPADMEMMYNTTRLSLLRSLSSRYMQSAVDWKSSTCDFDNADFIAILEAVSRIKETPEPENFQDLDTTPVYVRMKEGTLYTAAIWINSVRALAIQEHQAGAKLSVIGYPTVDGGCGTDFTLEVPIGICSQSKSTEGCWAYLM